MSNIKIENVRLLDPVEKIDLITTVYLKMVNVLNHLSILMKVSMHKVNG
jgi:hypothetical protein